MTAAKGDIVYSEDIIRNVAKQLKVPERRVKFVFDFLFFYVRKKSKEPDCYSINLPKVGRVYLSAERLKKTLAEREIRDTVSKKQRERHNADKAKVERLEALYESEAGGKFMRTVHKKGENLFNYFWNGGLTLKQLEQNQNKQ